MDKISVLGVEKDNQVTDKKTENKPKVSTKEGLSHFGIGAVLALASFLVARLITAFLFEPVHYVLVTLSTVFISYLFIGAYDYATAKQPTLKAGPVKNFTILFSFILLVNGYNNYSESDLTNLFNENKVESVIVSEQKAFGIVKHPGEVWTTNSTPNRTVVIKIRGAEAIVNNETLLTGDYAIKVPDNGTIKIIGVREITTSIEVVE